MKPIAIFDCDISFQGEHARSIARYLATSYQIYEAREDIFPQKLDDFRALIITGSAASANDDYPWIKKIEGWVRASYKENIPMLGICFGHQVIAKALGGKVERLPHLSLGWNLFSVDSPENRIFSGINNPTYSFSFHYDYVSELPPQGQVLQENDVSIQAFQIRGKNIYGFQHHPEFCPKAALHVVENNREGILASLGPEKGAERMNFPREGSNQNIRQIFTNFEKSLGSSIEALLS